MTLEISTATPQPVRVHANEGLCQILFFYGAEACEVIFAGRGWKIGNNWE